MHLLQEHRPRAHAPGAAARGWRATAAGVVADVVAQVQAVVGAARHAARARGAHGTHAGRRRPVGHQPVGEQAQLRRPGSCEGCALAGRPSSCHAGVEGGHGARQAAEVAVEAPAVEDLRHQAAVGQRRRVAVAVGADAGSCASWRSNASRPSRTQWRYQAFLASSSTLSSRTRYLSTRRLFSGWISQAIDLRQRAHAGAAQRIARQQRRLGMQSRRGIR